MWQECLSEEHAEMGYRAKSAAIVPCTVLTHARDILQTQKQMMVQYYVYS